MSNQEGTYSISGHYLRNLWQQAIFGGLGILASWAAFVFVSLQFHGALPLNELVQLPSRLLSDSRLWMMPTSDEIRELIRFGTGPAMAFCALLSGFADFSSWVAVRYDVLPDKLRMRWRRFTREVTWDLIQTVDERSHHDVVLRSLQVAESGSAVILVRGLDQMPEFIEVLRSRLPRQTRWTNSPTRIDLTNRLTNFVLGFLLFLPFSASWIAYYVIQSSSIGLFWSLILLVGAFWVWYARPLSRPHLCVREVEVFMAIAILLLSGVMTFIGWLDSPPQMAFSRLLGW